MCQCGKKPESSTARGKLSWGDCCRWFHYPRWLILCQRLQRCRVTQNISEESVLVGRPTLSEAYESGLLHCCSRSMAILCQGERCTTFSALSKADLWPRSDGVAAAKGTSACTDSVPCSVEMHIWRWAHRSVTYAITICSATVRGTTNCSRTAVSQDLCGLLWVRR